MNNPKFKMDSLNPVIAIQCYRCGYIHLVIRASVKTGITYHCEMCHAPITPGLIANDCGQVRYGPDRYQVVNAYYN